jgi:hypothetical protein
MWLKINRLLGSWLYTLKVVIPFCFLVALNSHISAVRKLGCAHHSQACSRTLRKQYFFCFAVWKTVSWRKFKTFIRFSLISSNCFVLFYNRGKWYLPGKRQLKQHKTDPSHRFQLHPSRNRQPLIPFVSKEYLL